MLAHNPRPFIYNCDFGVSGFLYPASTCSILSLERRLVHPSAVRNLGLVLAIAWASVGWAATITIDSNVRGLPFTVEGKSYRTPAKLEWAAGSTYTIVFEAISKEVSGTRYQFLKWMDSGDPYTRTITAGGSSASYTVIFTTQYLVTAVATPASGGTVQGGGWTDAGALMVIEATPAATYRFTAFTGDLRGATNPATISVTRPLNVVARFARR